MSDEVPKDDAAIVSTIIDLHAYRDMSVAKLLERARHAQLVDLVAKLEAGVLSHQEHAVLARLLKDSGMELISPPGNGTIEGTTNELPPPSQGPQQALPGPQSGRMELPTFEDEEEEWQD